jgi:hypothetical protein
MSRLAILPFDVNIDLVLSKEAGLFLSLTSPVVTINRKKTEK